MPRPYISPPSSRRLVVIWQYITIYRDITNKISQLSGVLLVPGSGAVEEHEQECGRQQGGAEGEGPGEDCGGDHEPEREGSYAGSGVEGRVPERAAEAVLGLGDACHHQDKGRVLEHPEPGSEERGPG